MTLREHLDAIVDRPFDDPAWNKIALQHALAALAVIDECSHEILYLGEILTVIVLESRGLEPS